MRRFFKTAAAEEAEGGWTVTLDGKPIRTPAKAPFVIASAPAATAAAAEWAAQGEEIQPEAMRVTKAINTAIDHTTPRRAEVVEAVAAYGGADLLCYRAATPEGLAARQIAAWDPLLSWAATRYGAALETQTGVMHADQPAEALAKLSEAVGLYPPLALTALSDLVALSGSLVLGLAVAEGRLDYEAAWAASRIDESWQEEHWGVDADAARLAAYKAEEFAAAARLIALSDGA